MTLEERQSTVETNQEIVPAAPEPGAGPIPQGPAIQTSATVSRRSLTVQASGAEMARRIIVLIFGLIQAVIALRIVLLLLDAREGNALVAGIINISSAFVAPFEGILRTNAVSEGGSVLDIAALVAIVGWTLLELGAFAVLNLFRRETGPGT